MTTSTPRDRAAELRIAFDRGFAEPPVAAHPAYIDLLRVSIGGLPHVLALSEIAAIHVDQHVVPLPTTAAELLGVIAVRASIVPVYDLRVLLGIPPTAAPRWTVLAAGPDAGGVAFAFDAFDGHLRLTTAPVASAGRLLRGIVSHEGRTYPVVDLAAAAREVWNKER